MRVFFEPGRVVEIWAAADGSGTVGSGYLLGGGVLLTAGHVVDKARGGGCEIRPLGTGDWLPAEQVWRGDSCDAALLRMPSDAGGGDAAACLGRLGRNERAPCRGVGFPFAQAKRGGDLRDTEDLAGEIAPLSTLKGGVLTVHIAGSVPTADRSGHSPWEGMSGAAVFSGPLIVGVAIVAPADFGTDRLEAVPITTMAAETAFRQALTGDPDRELVLRAVEDVDITRGVLREPHRPLPAKATPERLRRGATHFLVAAEYGVVPFHGRSKELKELLDWCAGDPGLELWVLLGAGGTGKTRLAAELCRVVRTRGALAGFLAPGADTDAIAALGEVVAPLLVVVDEAHAHVDRIATLLTTLADVPSHAPLRVLLLARQAGEWWDTSLPRRLGGNPDAELASGTATMRELGPVDSSVAAREQAFDGAGAAFAGRMNLPAEELPLPDLRQDVFEQILFVHLAVLSALEGDRNALQGGVVRDDLLRSALQREARYWADTASSLQLEAVPLERAVALATLTVADSEDQAASALAAVPDFEDASQERRRGIARWLRDLYPLPATEAPPAGVSEPLWFRPLTPVPLGEALIAHALETAPALPTRLLAVATASQAGRALAVLNQASRAHSSVKKALRRATSDHLATQWSAALEVAQETGDPIGRLLAEALDTQPQPRLAAQIEAALPEETVALRELSVVATRQALEACSTSRQARSATPARRRSSTTRRAA